MNLEKYGKPIFAIVVVVMVVSVSWLSYFYLGGGQEAFTGGGGTTPPPTASLAPDFSYPAVGGGTVSLSALKGKVVILDFMATWCQPCKNQIANLKTIYSEYSVQGVSIISIDIDPQDSSQHLTDYRTERGATWQFVLDSNGVYLEPKYSATSIPTIIIINKNGEIAKRNVGPMSVEALKKAIDPLL